MNNTTATTDSGATKIEDDELCMASALAETGEKIEESEAGSSDAAPKSYSIPCIVDDEETLKKKIMKRGRRGDPRMHLAVAMRMASPKMSLLDALKSGGFKFPTLDESGKAVDPSIQDSDNVPLAQRKNQLSRRLRLARLASVKDKKLEEMQHDDTRKTSKGQEEKKSKKKYNNDESSDYSDNISESSHSRVSKEDECLKRRISDTSSSVEDGDTCKKIKKSKNSSNNCGEVAPASSPNSTVYLPSLQQCPDGSQRIILVPQPVKKGIGVPSMASFQANRLENVGNTYLSSFSNPSQTFDYKTLTDKNLLSMVDPSSATEHSTANINGLPDSSVKITDFTPKTMPGHSLSILDDPAMSFALKLYRAESPTLIKRCLAMAGFPIEPDMGKVFLNFWARTISDDILRWKRLRSFYIHYQMMKKDVETNNTKESRDNRSKTSSKNSSKKSFRIISKKSLKSKESDCGSGSLDASNSKDTFSRFTKETEESDLTKQLEDIETVSEFSNFDTISELGSKNNCFTARHAQRSQSKIGHKSVIRPSDGKPAPVDYVIGGKVEAHQGHKHVISNADDEGLMWNNKGRNEQMEFGSFTEETNNEMKCEDSILKEDNIQAHQIPRVYDIEEVDVKAQDWKTEFLCRAEDRGDNLLTGLMQLSDT